MPSLALPWEAVQMDSYSKTTDVHSVHHSHNNLNNCRNHDRDRDRDRMKDRTNDNRQIVGKCDYDYMPTVDNFGMNLINIRELLASRKATRVDGIVELLSDVVDNAWSLHL